MVTVKGRMAVNVINGRNGQFSVATLYSEIGDFVVRYEGLDQYDAGTYEGKFVIRDTDVWIRAFGVGKIIEPVVFLQDLILDNADEGLQESIPDAIPDPAEDEPKPRRKASLGLDKKAHGDFSHDELKQLFGKIWPLGEQIQLDPTVGRPIFRAQKEYLKSVGYKFDPTDQVWNKRH
ncbi:MAG: DUF3275 family protein [Candidatus Thiodiazotropha sp. (ex. Lucinisca nassula)]|nr:DUF3275 family protein [Candidatus Thiodiazotropha sp. (ex. Lucinisca nassula)]